MREDILQVLKIDRLIENLDLALEYLYEYKGKAKAAVKLTKEQRYDRLLEVGERTVEALPRSAFAGDSIRAQEHSASRRTGAGAGEQASPRGR